MSIGGNKMNRAIYPGSFDPVTNGHLDIIERAAKVFDELVVVVMINPDKKGLFTPEERVELIKRCIVDVKNVRVDFSDGLTVEYMKANDIKVIVKGLRAVSDFEYEFQMALMNNKLDSNVETVFLSTNSKYSYLSSSSVKQVARFGGCIEGLVHGNIIGDIFRKVNRNK